MTETTSQYLSSTGTIHRDERCSVTAARHITNTPIDAEQAQIIEQHPEWFQVCKRCGS